MASRPISLRLPSVPLLSKVVPWLHADSPNDSTFMTTEQRVIDALFLQALIFNSQEIFSWMRHGGSAWAGAASVGPAAGDVRASLAAESSPASPAAAHLTASSAGGNKLNAFVAVTEAEFSAAHTAEAIHAAPSASRGRLQQHGGRVAALTRRLERFSEDAVQAKARGSFLFSRSSGSGDPLLGSDEDLEQLRQRWLHCLRAAVEEDQVGMVGEDSDSSGVRLGGSSGTAPSPDTSSWLGSLSNSSSEASAEALPEASGEAACRGHQSVDSSIKWSKEATKQQRPGFACVPVLYATTRARSHSATRLESVFTKSRGDLTFGVSWVSVPDQLGHLGTPRLRQASTTWRYHANRRGIPRESVAVLTANGMEECTWVGAVGNISAISGDDRVLIFVHGFHTPFVNAARRVAQVVYTANFRGVALLFSWPSGELLTQYATAEDTLTWTVPDLVHVLRRVQRAVGPAQFHILAHSLGCRLATYALSHFIPEPDGDPPFSLLVLAAPDIDLDEFFKRLPELSRCFRSLLLYCSSEDQALSASRSMHGGYPRLGDFRGLTAYMGLRERVERLPCNVAVVDTTKQDDSLLSHSYIFTSCLVTVDCSQALRGLEPEDRPWLAARTLPSGMRFWEFQLGGEGAPPGSSPGGSTARRPRGLLPSIRTIANLLSFPARSSSSARSRPGSDQHLPGPEGGDSAARAGLMASDLRTEASAGAGKSAAGSEVCRKLWENESFRLSNEEGEDEESVTLAVPEDNDDASENSSEER